MKRYQRVAYALLIAGALLAGCDISSPASATPTPNNASQPGATPPAGTTAPGGAPADNATAYPLPEQLPTATFPPGYIPPPTAQP